VTPFSTVLINSKTQSLLYDDPALFPGHHIDASSAGRGCGLAKKHR